MAYLEYRLSEFRDPEQFENLCAAVMHREGYSSINQMGGTNDKGRDAENITYLDESGPRKILFQFSLEKNHASKVKRTLKRIQEANLDFNELIFMFSTRLPAGGLRDQLKDFALNKYGYAIEIYDQRFLALRLSHPRNKDVVLRFFYDDIADLKCMLDSGDLFSTDAAASEKEQRCLVNLMSYAKHPLAGDIRSQVIAQAIIRILSISFPTPTPRKEVLQLVADYLPATLLRAPHSLSDDLDSLAKLGKIAPLPDQDTFSLPEAEYSSMAMDMAEIVAGRQDLLSQIKQACFAYPGFTATERDVEVATDEFFAALFRQHGIEVAHVILETNTGHKRIENALDQDKLDSLLSNTVSTWKPIDGNAFRNAIKMLLRECTGPRLEYMNALSRSYTCMQLLNIDPESVNVQRRRVTDSVAVLDTDVVLSGIVRGSDREAVSRSIAELCDKLRIRCFAYQHSIEEIVSRIERSIRLYEDLGRPNLIPPDKKDLVHDLFLDIFFEQISRGTVRTFEQFLSEYYPFSGSEPLRFGFIKRLIEERLGIPIENAEAHLLLPQDDKLQRIRATIEESRASALAYKNPKLYQSDALTMIVVEQQNRELINNKRLGRWYLVSSDRHILNAYLSHKHAFKVKPSILPIYFLEVLRQSPDSGVDENTFGSILRSEAMIRGPGRDYASIIAGLTRVGLDALGMPTNRLIELIDIMDRADLTQWIVRLRGQSEISDALREQILDSLKKVADESASRSSVIEQMKRLQQNQTEK